MQCLHVKFNLAVYSKDDGSHLVDDLRCLFSTPTGLPFVLIIDGSPIIEILSVAILRISAWRMAC